MRHLRNAKLVPFVIGALSGWLPGTNASAAQAAATPPAQHHPPARRAGQLQLSPDFETYRVRIEPIFLKQRRDGVRCYDCHSRFATRLRLEPLSPGAFSWTAEQSRRNFEVVCQLVMPSDPLKSPLLLRPLAREAGGDPIHTGGKFWGSQNDPEWKTLADWIRHSTPAPATAQAALHSVGADVLDFQFFKTTIEPIFLKERPGHAPATVATSSRTEVFISRRCHRVARIGLTTNRGATSRALFSRLFPEIPLRAGF